MVIWDGDINSKYYSTKLKNKQIMEVGILTFSRVHNYGAILQCYALYESLKI